MSLEDDVQNLASVPTFGALELDALRLLAFAAETKILRRGAVLFREGEASDAGYVVMSGALTLETAAAGRVMVAGPGTLIGDLALLVETARPATAIARDSTSVLKISRELFQRVLREHPVSARRLREFMTSRVKDLGAELSATQP